MMLNRRIREILLFYELMCVTRSVAKGLQNMNTCQVATESLYSGTDLLSIRFFFISFIPQYSLLLIRMITPTPAESV